MHFFRHTHARKTILSLAFLSLAFTIGCRKEEPKIEEPVKWPEIAGYAAMPIPAGNPMTRAKVDLGKQLYYDRRLSGDGTRSCYDCHLVEYGLTDGKPKAIGAYETPLPRRSPSLWNIGYHTEFYWEGRSGSLEAQAKAAWTGGNMGVSGQNGRPSADDIAARLNQIEGYRRQFQEVFGGPATPDNMMQAVAAFERTIVSDDSPWIRFINGDQAALPEAARRGYDVFKGKARCTNCHDGRLMTDLLYHNTGIGWDPKTKKFADEGRVHVSKAERDTGAFKTPSLIDVARRSHFFHDGSVSSLEEAVDLMLAGGIPNPYIDGANLHPPVKLTKEERDDLLAFLRALTANYKVTPPQLPQ